MRHTPGCPSTQPRSSSSCRWVGLAIILAFTLLLGSSTALELPRSFNSRLPVLVIDTFGVNILSDQQHQLSRSLPYTAATLTAHYPDQPNNLWRSEIGIKCRGRSSMRFPKKQFGIEMREGAHPRRKSVLGLPPDQLFTLYAPYADKSLIRNQLSYNLSQEMGHYASKSVFVEVYLAMDSQARLEYPGNYYGIYALCEYPRVSRNRLDLKPWRSNQRAGPFLLMVDRPPSERSQPHSNRAAFFSGPKTNATFILEWPPHPAAVSYASGYISRFERALFSKQFRDPRSGKGKGYSCG